MLPATANIIAKAAHGIADEVVSLSILAASCPVVFVPSMNEIMWNKKIVQKNVAELRRAGHVVIEPVVGLEISTLTPSNGCMPPVDQVFASLAAAKIAIAGKKKSPNKK